jgi:hypothetical protein
MDHITRFRKWHHRLYCRAANVPLGGLPCRPVVRRYTRDELLALYLPARNNPALRELLRAELTDADLLVCWCEW